MARRARISNAQILEALRVTCGNQTQAAKELERQLGIHIDRSTISKRIAKDEKLAAAVADVEEIALDMAENALLKAIKNGNITAIIFYLKTKGKNRGYVEKEEPKKKCDIIIIDDIPDVEEEYREIRNDEDTY